MDLLEFERPELYFEREDSEQVCDLLDLASRTYGEPQAARALQQARDLEPESLAVLVAVYRYRYYQHDLQGAREVGIEAATIAARQLGISEVDTGLGGEFQRVFRVNPGLARFYLQALKGVGYLSLRLGDWETARSVLSAVAQFDSRDRLGCRALLEFASGV